MTTLIIGGSRGIGFELGKLYAAQGERIPVTGRKHPDQTVEQIEFKELNLSKDSYIEDIERLIQDLDVINRLVFAPGYYQGGTVTDLAKSEILDMIQVCGTSGIFTARAILKKQDVLNECIVITSTSQWKPRKLEPIYNFAKAGIAHFAHALSLDERVGKLLVAGPTGTKTAFQAARNNVDMSTYHEPAWVAKQIFDYAQGNYSYKFIKILRDPAEVQIAVQE